MRSFFYLTLLGVGLLTLALVVRSGMLASKHFDEPLSAAMRAAMAEESPQLTTEDATIIRRDYPTAYTMRSGLMYINRGPGSGPMPTIGQTAVVEYSVRLLDGTPIDSSKAKGAPLRVKLGVGADIKGFDEALLTMKKGSKRLLIIPYWLAYGDAGRPPQIPPRATLVLEVELVDFR